jgi:peptidoglycan hydrolase-like protein with peptidoglycan-binding domain
MTDSISLLRRRVLPSEAASVKADLDAIRAPLAAGDPLNLGDTGPAVSALQRQLSDAGLYTGSISGTFDDATRLAVEALQKAKNLAVTGEVDQGSLKAVESIDLFVKDGFDGSSARLGQRGSDIARVEHQLDKLGFRPGAPDGVFDDQTLAALKRFRRSDKDVSNKGSVISSNLAKNLAAASRGFEHDPYRARRETKLKAMRHANARTERAASKPSGMALGDKGAAVLNMQKHLEAAGYDLGKATGTFGSRTGAALRAFQRATQLPETGILDKATWARLSKAIILAKSDGAPAQRLNEHSAAVKRSEVLLKKLGYKVGKVDGKFDARTQAASRRFERKHKGVGDDGSIGTGQLKKMRAALSDKQGARVKKFIDIAKAQRGDPYVFGADGPNAFDCSGLIYYALNHAGVKVPRMTAAGYQQHYSDSKVSRKNLKPGDLLFYWYPNTRGIPRGTASHIEIYLGHGKSMGTDNPSEGARIENVDWGGFIGGARVKQLYK